MSVSFFLTSVRLRRLSTPQIPPSEYPVQTVYRTPRTARLRWKSRTTSGRIYTTKKMRQQDAKSRPYACVFILCRPLLHLRLQNRICRCQKLFKRPVSLSSSSARALTSSCSPTKNLCARRTHCFFISMESVSLSHSSSHSNFPSLSFSQSHILSP